MRSSSSRRGFTLLEIMIVTTIIGLLMSMALPAFRQVRRNAQNTAFANDLRILSAALEQYAMANGVWPSDSPAGVVPLGMSGDIRDEVWTEPNSLGGKFGWTRSGPGVLAAISSSANIVQLSQIADLDVKIDDGSLTTGLLILNGTDLLYVLEADTAP